MTAGRRRGVGVALLVCLFRPAAAAGQQTLVVEPGGRYPLPSAAVAAAVPGDRIVIRAGEYREPSTLVVDRRVELAGDSGAVIDGGGRQTVLRITADSVAVRGLTIRNTGSSFSEDRAGIRIEGAAGCVVERNRVTGTLFGIYAAGASGCRIVNNVVHGAARTEAASGNAIHLWNSPRFVIADNRLRGHRDGLYLEFSPHAVLSGNDSRDNLRYGLHFMYSDSCRYAGNSFVENLAGVAVMYSHAVIMRGNRFERSRGAAAYGLLLKEIKDARVEDNLFAGNTVGVHADASDRLVLEGNRFVRNGWALRLLASTTGAVLRHNEFTGNSFDVATNSRTTTGTIEENYWDRYTGYDLDRDGFGDVPFRPVRLFALIVEQHAPALILMRSFVLELLDLAERVLPVLTPDALMDSRPLMARAQ